MTHRFAGSTVLVASLAVALAAAGCGGDNSDSTSTATITKTEFVAKANAVCAAGNKAKPSVANIQGQIDSVRALGAPSGDEATVTKMLDTAQADLDTVKGNPALLNGKSDPFKDFAALAHPYGLTQCAPDS
jgi:hypothetical protein